MSIHTIAQQPLTLLVVDPNQEILNLVNAVLAVNNNRVMLADCEERGFNLALAEQPDVILATSGLHEVGQALCQRVRQEPLLAQTPFVMLTTSSNRRAYTAYFASGCDQILPVPFKCSDIQAAIKNACRRNLEENQEKIHALFRSGFSDFIDAHALDRFLAAEEILCFHRRDGLAVVGRDPIRRGTRTSFTGPERRRAM